MSILEIIGALACIAIIGFTTYDIARRIRGVQARAACVGFGRKDKQ